LFISSACATRAGAQLLSFSGAIMSTKPDIILDADDAVALRELLARTAHSADAEEALEALTTKLLDATIVEPHALPPGTVRLRSTVTYEELPAGTRRNVTLVNPPHADAASGRISILSPVGRALLGQKRGRATDVTLPGGRQVTLRVLEATTPSVHVNTATASA
jgi:regulator of nucleoside diphosphate kinase